MKKFVLVATMALGLGVFACDVADDLNPIPKTTGRCDFRPKKPQCTDLRNYGGTVPAKTILDGICVEGTTNDSQCPVDGMLGGCQTDNGGGQQTNWYYAGEDYKTVDDVKKQCTESDKATFVNPG